MKTLLKFLIFFFIKIILGKEKRKYDFYKCKNIILNNYIYMYIIKYIYFVCPNYQSILKFFYLKNLNIELEYDVHLYMLPFYVAQILLKYCYTYILLT